jgi:hypothetical protein
VGLKLPLKKPHSNPCKVELDKTFCCSVHHTLMTILDQMTSTELEAFAAKLHAQIDRSPQPCRMPKVALEDVKGWLASQKREAESYSELSFFLNLL